MPSSWPCLLASIGLYGFMAFAVANRRREFSIRIAIGAARANIMQLVMRHGAKLLAIGLLVGLLGGYAAARGIASQWSEVSVGDPLVFATTGFVLALVTLLASCPPRRQHRSHDCVEDRMIRVRSVLSIHNQQPKNERPEIRH